MIRKACLSVLSLREQRWVAVERISSRLVLALLCVGILSSSRLWTEQVPVRQKGTRLVGEEFSWRKKPLVGDRRGLRIAAK